MFNQEVACSSCALRGRVCLAVERQSLERRHRSIRETYSPGFERCQKRFYMVGRPI